MMNRTVKTVNHNLSRNSRFSLLGDKDVQAFEAMIGSKALVTDQDELTIHNTDWTKKFQGHSKLMLKPSTTEEVSAILKYCNERKLAVTPQGGRTGLVGGSIPVHDEIIVSTMRMNKIIGFDESYGILQSEAGCILEDLQNFAKERKYEVPLDLGAKGSCMIGGNLATNAGGIKFIRHNSLHANCVGLKAVLADGTILDNMTTLRKDNTGYDLKHLFIGSEGTLGLITEGAILCPSLPMHRNVCVVACNSFDEVLKILQIAKAELGDVLQAVEMMDAVAIKILRDIHPEAAFPFSDEHPFYALVEIASAMDTSASDAEDSDLDRMYGFVESIEDQIIDGVVSQDEKQLHQLWFLREGLSNSTVSKGYTLKYDVSLPSSQYYKIVERVREQFQNSSELTSEEKDSILTNGHGHVGDGNLHLNITVPGYENVDLNNKVRDMIDPFVMDYVRSVGGSVSAEHGIGIQKPKYLHYSKSDAMISTMHTIKNALDPNGILNPYKVLA